MPSTYTTNLGIELPADGELDGVWGDVVNENMDILDRAINGSIALSLSGTTSTLTTSDGALSDGQYKLLVLGGSPSGTHTITIAPSDAQKIYFVRNTTAQSVVFTQGSGGNVTIATGDSAIIYSDGAGAGAAVVNITNDFAMSSVKITGGTIDGTVIGGTSAAAVTGTTITGTSFVSSGDMTFGDNDKAIFGAGSDLQIYHDGTNSYIDDQGSGRIIIKGNDDVRIRSGADEEMIVASSNGAVTLYHDSFPKLATTATGVTVTGDVGATTGTFSGDVTIADKIVHSGDTNTAIRFPAADTVTVETSGTERMRIDSSGNVGIGTTAPAARLHVSPGSSGASLASGVTVAGFFEAAANASVQISSGTGSPAYLFLGDAADPDAARISAQDGFLQIAASGASDFLQFTTGGFTERMRIDSSGNVGIGTTTPGAELHVNNASASQGRRGLRFSASGWTGVYGELVIDTSAVKVDLNTSNGTYPLSFSVGSTERMRIDSSGNVGIGTTSPAQRLDVRTAAANAVQARFGFTSGRGLEISTALVSGTNDAGSVLNALGSTAGTMIFQTDSTERMRIDSAGNVGIGTTSPASRLNVVGDQLVVAGGSTLSSLGIQIKGTVLTALPTAQVQGYIATGDSAIGIAGDLLIAPRTTAAASIRFITGTTPTERLSIGSAGVVDIKSDGTAAAPSLVLGTDTDTGLFRPATNTLAVSTAGTERMRINASGNVGIGTTAPAAKLEVALGAEGEYMRVGGDNATNGRALRFTSSTAGGSNGALHTINASSATGAIALATNSTERMRINSSGNVGIGTSSPATALDVNGDVTIADKIVHSGDTNTSIRFPAADTVTVETSGAERLRITDIGRFGLGVTNPAARLQVAALSSSSATVIAATEVDYTANFRSSQLVYNPVDTTGTTFGFSNSNLGALSFLNTTNAVIGTNGATPLAFATTSLERMRIDSSGNVGIGTTAPATNLEVVGTIRASGTAPILSILDSGGATDEKEWQFRGGDGPLVVFAINEASGSSGDYLQFTRVGNSVRTIRGLRSGTTSYDLSNYDRSLMFSGGVSTIGTATAHDLVFESNDTERMRITSAGNVGIGTSSPATALDVIGDIRLEGGTPSIRFAENDTTNIDGRLRLQGGDLLFETVTDANVLVRENMRITDAGDVGINESSPDYRLDVNGAIGFTPGASVTPVDNGDVVFELTNNTTLTIKAKGSDGVVRSATITLA